MPFDTSTLGVKEKEIVKGFEKELLAVLQKCRDGVAAGRAGTALDRWFGDHADAFAKEVKVKVAKLRSHLNSTNIKCELGKGLSADNNAQANHFTAGFIGVSSLLAVTNAKTQADQFAKVMVGPNFKSLAKYATTSLGTFATQDQFETLAHELSHVVFGTKDVANADGGTAYGGDRARRLVTEDVAKAKNNAENWGFFIEEFR